MMDISSIVELDENKHSRHGRFLDEGVSLSPEDLEHGFLLLLGSYKERRDIFE